jgi:glucan biosynthesis protein
MTLTTRYGTILYLNSSGRKWISRACWVAASKENMRTRRRNPIPTWIQYDANHSLWNNIEERKLDIQFFHVGMGFRRRVRMF